MSNRQLVLRANELFHDLQGEEYETVHPEIFSKERDRWMRQLHAWLPKTKPRVLLDVGAGTGFLESILVDILEPAEKVILADISKKMLETSKKKLEHRSDLRVETLHVEDERIPLASESVHVVMMNSVLHHMPDPKRCIDECVRVLQSRGVLFIGHEPNMRFFQSRFLLGQFQFLQKIRLKRLVVLLLEAIGLRRKTAPHPDVLLAEINRRLLEEHVINIPLTAATLSEHIDAHSPTAGGLHLDRGFDVESFFRTWPNMETLYIETYNHLAKIKCGYFFRAYDRFLRLCFPSRGATFFIVLRKR